MGEGALRCSLTLSPKALPDSPMYASGQLMVWEFVVIYDPTFVCFGVLVLWDCLVVS